MLNALYELSNIIFKVIYFTDNNTKAKKVNLAKEVEPVLNSGNLSSFTCHRTQPSVRISPIIHSVHLCMSENTKKDKVVTAKMYNFIKRLN